MTDITKCKGEGCDKKDTCYRYTAPEGMLQSYFLGNDPEDCKHYWKINEDDK